MSSPSPEIRQIDLRADPPDNVAAAAIDPAIARRLHVIPVRYEGDRLLVAMVDPTDATILNEVAAVVGLAIEPAQASPEAIAEALLETYGAPETAETSRTRSSRVGLDATDKPPLDLHEVLELVLEYDASDLHLTNGLPPVLRIDGELLPIEGYDVLEPEMLQRIVYGMLTQKQREKFEENLELDFSYALPGKARFRVNVYQQRNALGMAFRLIPFTIKSLDQLGLPGVIEEFSRLPRGLVVVTGPTGSGKSTSLAALVDVINRERAVHIMTVEDPIEFLHAHKTAVVNQREVGTDTLAFKNALKHVLRQDPDVILVGEMRDLETMEMAVTAAETGHLVFATLHTQDAAQTVDRIIDAFPTGQQQQIRVQLAGALQGVVAQQLLKHADGVGRVVATEILMVTPAVRNLIREGKTHQLYSVMQAGAQYGMQTMDASLADAVQKGVVRFDEAKERCHNVEEFSRLSGSGAPTHGGAEVRSVSVG
ncbi:MAG: PilT/PilU family type 4a pilus ATPase [Actinomycetota bacterium]